MMNTIFNSLTDLSRSRDVDLSCAFASNDFAVGIPRDDMANECLVAHNGEEIITHACINLAVFHAIGLSLHTFCS